MNWAIYSAMDRIPLGIAVTIEFAGPLAVAVFASRRALDLLWVALAAAGILLLADPGGGSIETAGVLFALLAATMWAAYIVLAVRVGRVFPGSTGLAIAMVVGAVVIAPVGIAQGGSELLQPELLAAGAAVALASSVIPYSLDLEALRLIPARVFGVLMSLEPARRRARRPRRPRAAPRRPRVGRHRPGGRGERRRHRATTRRARSSRPAGGSPAARRARGRAASPPRPARPRSPPRSVAAHAAPPAAGGG